MDQVRMERREGVGVAKRDKHLLVRFTYPHYADAEHAAAAPGAFISSIILPFYSRKVKTNSTAR